MSERYIHHVARYGPQHECAHGRDFPNDVEESTRQEHDNEEYSELTPRPTSFMLCQPTLLRSNTELIRPSTHVIGATGLKHYVRTSVHKLTVGLWVKADKGLAMGPTGITPLHHWISFDESKARYYWTRCNKTVWGITCRFKRDPTTLQWDPIPVQFGYLAFQMAIEKCLRITNALLPSSVEVYINNGATGVHYRGGISPRGAIRTSPFHEHMYLPYHGPSVSSGSNVVAPLRHQPHSFGAGATTPEIHPADRRISHPVGYATPLAQGHQVEHPGSCGFESALDDVKGHAVLQVHQPSLSPERPWSMKPISILSASSSTAATPPFNAQPPFLCGGEALPQISFADYQVFDNSGYGIQSAHRHHILQPGGPRAYMVDGLLIDEEHLMDGNGGYINVHACGREGPPCGLWVKADKRSIIRHGQRWHGDARGGGENKKTTCPWSGCDSQMLANTIPRHILSAHFGVVWICTCIGCSKPFGRHDSFTAHSRKCGSLEAIVQYDASTRVIDTTNVSRHYD
ncbi:hypothetical protein C8R48DRAFT_668246 [Suillus tomentosus]|nr:hypothetical protein C8R48DRAFT_668246 [Suillus tomentosus]